MKKINTLTFVAAIAMSVGLLASCGNKSSGGSQGGKDKKRHPHNECHFH